ncbi:MAG: radical SAM protein [Candidatus Aminicenantes bacterium]
MELCKAEKFYEQISSQKDRPLHSLNIELTRRCNFDCVHCFCAIPEKSSKQKDELNLGQWNDILNQSEEEGVLNLTFTGGEPLLYPDFRKLWITAKKKGFLVTLFSNGSLIDEELADFLAEWTPAQVSVTLYGSTEETYQKVTRRHGMFEPVIRSLELLAERKIILEVKGVFNRLNVHEFSQVRDIALRYCDLFRWDAGLVGGYPGCKNHPQSLRISPEEYVELGKKDPVRDNEQKEFFENRSPSTPNRKSPFRCNVGYGEAHIDAYGYLHPCLLLESLKYDLKTGNIKEGWHKAVPQMLKNLSWKPGPCQTCKAANICGQCVGFAILEGCPPTGPVPYRCRLAKARIKAYGIKDKKGLTIYGFDGKI